MAPGTEVGSVFYTLDLDDKNFKSKLKSASDDVRGFRGALKLAESGSKAFAGALTAVGVAGLGAIGFGVKMAADIETARTGFVTLLGSVKKADEAIEMIKRDAARTPFELSGLVRANQLLSSVTKDAGRSEGILLNVGKALAAAGKGGEELDRVIVNLQQIANTGHITEMDIRQFGFAGINILELLADQYGVTKEEAGEMVKASSDAFGDLEKAFEKAGSEGGRFGRAFIDQAGTFNQLMSNFKDSIAITAEEIVQQTGVFDTVKRALGGLVQFIADNTPRAVEAMKNLGNFIRDNFPVITGLIVGGLTPAIVSLASGFVALMAPLLPFIAVGTAIGAIIQGLINAFGGWDAVMEALNPVIAFMGDIFRNLILPQLQGLWSQISTQLLPALKELWSVISPVLIPVLKVLAVVLGATVVASIVALTGILRVLIAVFTEVVQAINRDVQRIKDFFASIPGAIANALSGIRDIILRPFQDAFNAVIDKAREAVNKVKEALDFTKRHSPSVIDIVRKGVGLVNKELENISQMTIPSVSADLSQRMATAPSTSTNQNINMYINKVGDMQDVRAIGRELGFRTGLDPRMFEN